MAVQPANLVALRGVVAALFIAGLFLGMTSCNPNLAAEYTIVLFIVFGIVSGVVLKSEQHDSWTGWGKLFLASVAPPAAPILYILAVSGELGCERITGGLKHPTPDWLLRAYVLTLALVWLGILASEVIRAIATWSGSGASLRFLDKLTVRVERVGRLFDKILGLSKLEGLLMRLFKKPSDKT